MSLAYVRNIFKNHSVCVCGMKGSGKDLLLGNIIARNKNKYVSNLDYTNDNRFHLLDFDALMLSHNDYNNIISGKCIPYVYPYGDNCDVYISDVGIYFPSQYCNELNRKYHSMPFFMALSRQLGNSRVHINTQNLNRCWDKIREQSDMYIICNWCRVIFGCLVIQKITIYDKYESCLNRVKPCRITKPLICSPQASATYDTYLDNFFNIHGEVKSKLLVYFNKSKHDTRYFEKFFRNGGHYEK